ncbi:MAG: GAF domain-containing protein [candidate division Zixibacteria bacterium]|nr:GAF domain-containing protein [candidate division Zixibacteria bacterium]
MPRKRKVDTTCQLETELALLYEISSLVQLSPSNKETFEKVLELIGKVIDFRSASMFLVSMETGLLNEIAKIGRSVELISFVKFEMGMGFSAWVAKEKRPIVLNNLRKNHNGANIKSFMSVPMIFKDELIGVINFAHDQSNSFTERDMQIVGIIAAETAVTIERMIYEYQLEIKNKELIEANIKLKEAQTKLIELEKKQTAVEMAATLNHEINNPLAIIAGNAQFLLMTMKNSNPSIIKRLKAIDKEASAIAQITEKFKQLDTLITENYVKGDSRKIINLKKSTKAEELC